MGLIAMPFIFTFIVAIVGAPFFIAWFSHDKREARRRAEIMERQRKVDLAVCKANERCFETKRRYFTDSELNESIKHWSKVYGVEPRLL